MKIDLSHTNALMPIDVRNHKTLVIQCRPGGVDPSSAVIEAKRAFSGRLDSPSVSFSSAVTLTPDGSAVTEIDVTDTAWIHLVCTTAVSGASVDVFTRLSGEMSGDVVELPIDASSPGLRGFTAPRYKAFVLADPRETVSTGVLEMKQAIDAGLQAVSFSPAASLTLDGSTITEIDTESAGVLHAACTTEQSGLDVRLYIYLRDEVTADTVVSGGGGGIDSGSSFPGSPSDGDTYIRTDFDMPELFTYDGTRGKWLGELRMWTFGRDTANSSLLALSMGSRVIANTSRGYVTPVELTIVGAEMFNSASGLSCELNFMEGSTSLTTLLTFSNDRAKYDHTLNYDIDADAADPQKYVKIENITAGAANNPMGTLYLRRRAT